MLQSLFYRLATLWSDQNKDAANIRYISKQLLHQTLAKETCSTCDEHVLTGVEVVDRGPVWVPLQAHSHD